MPDQSATSKVQRRRDGGSCRRVFAKRSTRFDFAFVIHRRLDSMNPASPSASALLAAGVCCLLACGCPVESTPEERVDQTDAGPRSVVALGRLEPAGGIVAISAIPGERLLEYAEGVAEGAEVPSGSELARLASYDLRDQQLLALEARKRLASAKREHELAVARTQLDQARAALAQAEAKLQEVRSQEGKLDSLAEAASIAGEDYRLLAELQQQDPDLVTTHQLRKQRSASEQAASELDALQQNFPLGLAAAQRGVEAAEANVRLAEANIEMLTAADETEVLTLELATAEKTRDQSKLVAPGKPGDPTEYTVLKKYLAPGEFITQMPVLEIADLSQMVCIAEVYEADVKEIRLHQKATIESAAFSKHYPDGLRGVVQRIGAIVSSPGLTNRNPLAPSDRSVVEVVVSIDNDLSQGAEGASADGAPPTATEEAASRVGLQVTVRFDPPEAISQAPSDRGDATAR